MTDLDDRLDNWARCVRNRAKRGHAQSFEGRYRSPQPWHEVPATAFVGALDYVDGWKVEAAWGTLPEFDRIILRGHYCLLWPPARICRTAAKMTGIATYPHRFDATLDGAKMLLEHALGQTESQNRHIVRDLVRKALDIVHPPLFNAD